MSNQDSMTKIRWSFIALYFIATLLSAFWSTPLAISILPIVTVIALFTAVFLHGIERYNFKNMLIFFLITWVVSHFFEALSIQTGFPFGFYHYEKLAGPRLFEVPLIIMFAYFAMGYASWSLANILINQGANPLKSNKLFLVPLIAAFIMVMWDLCMDPWASTVDSLWVWQEKGTYFGVPLKNYFGWFLVVYLIYQLFAFYIAKRDNKNPNNTPFFQSKLFWLEPIGLYATQAMTQILDAFAVNFAQDIFEPMALITIFTMLFVSLLALIKVIDSKKL
ncbi:MAG: carotenoid biosynthesis protein [Proteobacteria bacterium]|nr:carotenoid biosynthesis protein [Pseudomonadota bacterium]